MANKKDAHETSRKPTVMLDRWMADALDSYGKRMLPGVELPRSAVVHLLLREALEKRGVTFHPSGEAVLPE